MVDLKEITYALELAKVLGRSPTSPTGSADGNLPFREGDTILIRTVTMIQVGTVKAISGDYIVLDDGGWVADSGRFSECLSSGSISEFERAPSWFAVGKGSIVDVWPWPHKTPKATK